MASEGPNSPSTATTAAHGASDWSNSTNAFASDNSRASVSLGTSGGTETSYYLILKGFGFSIPGGATIDGATAVIERCMDDFSMGIAKDETVKLVKAGVLAGDNKAETGVSWPGVSSEGTQSYGGASDLWGTSLSSTDVNHSGFGVAVAATNTGIGSCGAYVDHAQLTVNYTAAADTLMAQIALSIPLIGAALERLLVWCCLLPSRKRTAVRSMPCGRPLHDV